MSVDSSTEREIWLRLACLVVSVGLHAALLAAGWRGLAAFSGDERPMVVTLGVRPAATSLQAGPVGPDALANKRLATASRRESRVSARVAPPIEVKRAEDPVPTVPEAATIEMIAVTRPAGTSGESPPAFSGEVAGVSALVAGGEGSANGAAVRGDGGGEEAGAQNGVEAMTQATPRYAFNPKPDYPLIARQNRWEGTVRVRARVTAGGMVEDISLEQSSGQELLDRSALDSVRRWRFIPASRGGMAVPCDVSIPVEFKLAERGRD